MNTRSGDLIVMKKHELSPGSKTTKSPRLSTNRSITKMERNYESTSNDKEQARQSKEYLDKVNTQSKEEPTFNDTEQHLEDLE